MKTVQLEVPDQLAKELHGLVEQGWFTDESEAARFALGELVRHRRFRLLEDQQREDIAWALRLKGAEG